MLIWSRALGPFATNCYIVACPDTRRAAVVDPGQPDPWIRRVVADQQLAVDLILLTHGHVDHIGGVEWARGWSGAPVLAHQDEERLLGDPAWNGSIQFGQPIRINRIDRWLAEGDRVNLGNLEFQVLHTPGHTPGGICFYTPGRLVVGDTLFAGSVGRTDLPGGDTAQLLNSIRTRIYTLPPETVVYPGHGPETSVGDEQSYNPFT